MSIIIDTLKLCSWVSALLSALWLIDAFYWGISLEMFLSVLIAVVYGLVTFSIHELKNFLSYTHEKNHSAPPL